MAWIDHTTLTPYQGDLAHPDDLEATTDPPGGQHQAIIVDGIHDGGWLPPTVDPVPDWATFNMLIMSSHSFMVWAETLPTSRREDLKIAAVAQNLPALQQVYSALAAAIPPSTDAGAEWQAIADQHGIGLRLLSDPSES